MVKRLIILFVAANLLTAGCKQACFMKSGDFELQPGDLLFRDSDCGPMCDAIEKVTTGFEGMNLSHVGIAAKDTTGSIVVIEAVSSGVKVTELQTFLSRSSDAQGRPKVIVGRLKKPYRHLIPSAIKEAHALVGKPYDKLFEAGNNAYCCSELVYEAFLRANGGIALFELKPMTFNDPESGAILATWENYFSSLGVPVPEGKPGINPGAISRSPVMTIVRIYGDVSRHREKTG